MTRLSETHALHAIRSTAQKLVERIRQNETENG